MQAATVAACTPSLSCSHQIRSKTQFTCKKNVVIRGDAGVFLILQNFAAVSF